MIRRVLQFLLIVVLGVGIGSAGVGFAKKQSLKSKFYDFSDQLIDGEIKKHKTLYTEVRQQAKFDKLLKLQKHFLNKLDDTTKSSVFK